MHLEKLEWVPHKDPHLNAKLNVWKAGWFAFHLAQAKSDTPLTPPPTSRGLEALRSEPQLPFKIAANAFGQPRAPGSPPPVQIIAGFEHPPVQFPNPVLTGTVDANGVADMNKPILLIPPMPQQVLIGDVHHMHPGNIALELAATSMARGSHADAGAAGVTPAPQFTLNPPPAMPAAPGEAAFADSSSMTVSSTASSTRAADELMVCFFHAAGWLDCPVSESVHSPVALEKDDVNHSSNASSTGSVKVSSALPSDMSELPAPRSHPVMIRRPLPSATSPALKPGQHEPSRVHPRVRFPSSGFVVGAPVGNSRAGASSRSKPKRRRARSPSAPLLPNFNAHTGLSASIGAGGRNVSSTESAHAG